MQTIYVDTLLCVNLFIDYIILYFIRKYLRINSNSIKLILGSIVGALSVLGVFLPFYTRLFSVFYRLITAMLTVFVAFGKAKPKTFIIRTLAFLGVSIAFSGFVTLVCLTLKPKGIVVWGDTVYFDISPIMLIVCTLIAFISLSIFERLKEKLKPRTKIHRVTVYCDNSSTTFDSLLDTGCNLKEPFSGLPVIVAEKELLGSESFNEERMRIVPFNTLSGEGMIKAFKPKKVEIDGKEIKNGCYIGLSDGVLKNEIKSLMGAEITEGL